MLSMPDALWFRIACVAIAGAAGSLLRWGSYELVGWAAPRRWSIEWHLGTLVVNAIGCFLFGLLFEWLKLAEPLNAQLRLIILTGFLGAFTTYSAFAADTLDLQKQNGFPIALAFVAVQVVTGWIAIVGGTALGQNL
jgi:fluoride exporter